MTQAAYKSELRIYAYATLKIPLFAGQQITGVQIYRYQNQYPTQTTLALDGRVYEPLSFDAGLPPQRLELDSSQGTVVLPNTQEVRDLYNQFRGFSQAIILVKFISPDFPTELISERKAQVISSDISGAQISLELGTPVGLLDGNLLQRSFTSENVPNIVTTLAVSVG